MNRSSAEIQAEIIEKFGFFPPFFAPALDTPDILENLWQQTLSAYLNNPIPDLFKEKLAAVLARYCTVPYCLMCHSSNLSPLGMSAGEVLELLETAPLDYAEISLITKEFDGSRIIGWPSAGSKAEEAVLSCCVSIFLSQDAELCQKKLKSFLEPNMYQYLNIFLAYNRTALSWAELNPELSALNDKRVQDNFQSLIAQEPKLVDLFRDYQSRILDQSNRKMQWLTQENKRILESERERLYSYLAQAPIGFAVVEEPEHRFVMANKRYEELIGQTRLQGIAIRNVSPDEDEAFFNKLDEAYRSGQGYVITERPKILYGPNGSRRIIYVNLSVEPYRNPAGDVAGLLIVLNEVTDEVEARNKMNAYTTQLKELQRSFNAAMTSAQTGTWSIDLRTNEVTTSDNLAKLFGYEKLSGNVFDAIKTLTHPEDREEVNRVWQQSAQNSFPYRHEYRVILGSGETRWVLSRGATTLDDRGHPTYFAGILSDITDRKVSELALATEQHKLETIFKESPVAMALYRGPEFIIEKVNPTFCAMLGHREFVGKKFADAFAEILDNPFIPIFKKVFRTGEIFTTKEFKTNLIKRFGMPPEECYWDFTLAPTSDSEGNRYGVYFFGSDVTDRVHIRLALESARKSSDRANEAKSSFLANMSHEIRSPLSSIMGFSDLLKDSDLSRQAVSQYISVIDRNSHHLLRIIDDILDLAKVEAGKMLFEQINFSLPDLLTDFSSIMDFRAKDKGIEFKLDTSSPLPEFIQSDPTRIRQILVNVVGNAIKFTNRGQVELKVNFAKSRLRFEVSDTGPGLTQEQADQLFQAFHQGDATTTRKFGGSGLGLVLTRRIAESLGGSFVLERSLVGQGSVFVAEIQIESGSPKTMNSVKNTLAEESSKNLEIEARSLQGLRVLVVDDSSDNRELFTGMLLKSGASIDTAPNGSEGMAAALTNIYDVILMDVQMPIMDGHQGTRPPDSSAKKTIIFRS